MKKVRNIKENILIIGAGSGIGYDMLTLLLNNRKVKVFATFYKNVIHIKKKEIKYIAYRCK